MLTIWRSLVPVREAMFLPEAGGEIRRREGRRGHRRPHLGLARTSKSIGVWNQGIARWVPSGWISCPMPPILERTRSAEGARDSRRGDHRPVVDDGTMSSVHVVH